MSNFIMPNFPMSFCFFYVPQPYSFQIQKDLIPEAETFSPSDAENFKGLTDEKQQISLTREDLQLKGYQQSKKSWSEQQDKLLLKLCEDQNARFQEIAKFIPGRNAKMCYSRWRRLINQVKESWTEEENTRLKRLVNELGEDWKELAKYFKKRNEKQLKDHYLNYLRPNLNKGEWLIEDDLRLIELINRHGKNWKLIEQNMPQRSRNQIKNRFFGRIKRIDEQKKKRQENTI